MSESREWKDWKRRPYSIFGPLLLIAIGAVLLLKTLGVIEGSLWNLFLKTWPLLFVVSGLDSLYRGDSYVGGVVWTGFGFILLLGNLGYLEIAPWNAVLRLWPFIFVVWGLDILLHRRNWWMAVIGVLVGVGVLAVMLWMMAGIPGVTPGKMQTYQTQLEGAEEAVIKIEPVTGDLWVGRGAEPSNLAEAQITLINNEMLRRDYDVVDGVGYYEIHTDGIWFGNQSTRSEWQVKLNNSLPLEISTQLIVGEQTVNLSGLQIVDLQMETIVGESTLILPASGHAEIDTSLIMGEMVIFVLPGTALEINLDTGLASVSFPEDFTREGDILYSPGASESEDPLLLRVNLPIGSLRIDYAD